MRILSGLLLGLLGFVSKIGIALLLLWWLMASGILTQAVEITIVMVVGFGAIGSFFKNN